MARGVACERVEIATPYDLDALTDTMETLALGLLETTQSVALNCTGGTKLMSLAALRTPARPSVALMLEVTFSRGSGTGKPKVEWQVLPPSRSVAATPLQAHARATSPRPRA